MIAFGTSITDSELYHRCAEPGIQRVAEPDSTIFAYGATGSIFRSYNLLLEKAAKLDDLEALVLVHQDAEIVDDDFCGKVRSALSDPEVGVVGCVGALGVRSIAWWEGSVTWASFIHRYGEFGGGDIEAFSWARENMPAYAQTGEVDTVDGFLIALSPWVVQNVRFDESLGQLHGYDLDFCLQVRSAGKKVLTEYFRAIHYHSLDLVNEPETWVEAHMRIAEKWDGRMPGVGNGGGTWKERARRAEAESEVARAAAVSRALQLNARTQQLETQIDSMTGSIGWKLTEPLRWANKMRKRAQVTLRERRSNGSGTSPRS